MKEREQNLKNNKKETVGVLEVALRTALSSKKGRGFIKLLNLIRGV